MSTEITPIEEVHGSKPAWLWPGYCCSLDKELRRGYGIGCHEYNQMFIDQGGVCAICGEPPGIYKLAVDHNPETGEIRGLIHMRHNRVLTPPIVNYITDPPARKFKFIVSKAKQRQLDRRRRARRKTPQPVVVKDNGTRRKEVQEVVVTETYEEAIARISEE